MSAIETPEGVITMRAPTEGEALAFEDKHRAARRPRSSGEQVTGAVYDNGINELLGCVTSPDRKVLDVDDGWLSLYPGIADRMIAEFRRLGGYHIALQPCPEAIDAQTLGNFGRRALGFAYGEVKLCARRMTWPEYNAFQANQTGENFWASLAAQGKACLLSHQGDEVEKLLLGRPYLAMDLGLKLLDHAMGVAETKAGKSATASSSKTATSTSPLPVS